MKHFEEQMKKVQNLFPSLFFFYPLMLLLESYVKVLSRNMIIRYVAHKEYRLGLFK